MVVDIALFTMAWSSRELWSTFWQLISAVLGSWFASAIQRTWCAGTPWRESEGVLPMEAGGSFSTWTCFYRSICWFQHFISAAFELRKKPDENDAFAVATCVPALWPRRSICTRTRRHSLQFCVLQHSLWEDPARAAACPATHSSKVMSTGTGTLLWHTLFHHCFPEVPLVLSQPRARQVPLTPLSCGNMLKATNVSRLFLECG